MPERYFIKTTAGSWDEVSQDDFVQAERAAGFHPKPGCGPVATGGFGGSGVSGRVVGATDTAEQWGFDPEFVAAAWPQPPVPTLTITEITAMLESKRQHFVTTHPDDHWMVVQNNLLDDLIEEFELEVTE